MLTAAIFKNGGCECGISSNLKYLKGEYPKNIFVKPMFVYVKQFLKYRKASLFYFEWRPFLILHKMVEASKFQVVPSTF